MKLLDTIEKRYSVRKFSDKKPDWRDILECIDTARFAPMAGDNFSLKFIFVDNQKTIQKLAEAAQQPFISKTKAVVVVCTNPKRTTTLFKERGEIYCRQQAGAAIQNILLAITEKKLATCWIGHFVEEMVKKELKIPEGINVEAMLPIGYEKGKIKRKEKTDLDRLLYFGKWGNKWKDPFSTLNV